MVRSCCHEPAGAKHFAKAGGGVEGEAEFLPAPLVAPEDGRREGIDQFVGEKGGGSTPTSMPAVSPKATFVVIDEKTLAYGDLRSPGTAANLRARPDVEVCFIDVLTRRAVRVAGKGAIVSIKDAPEAMRAAFAAKWDDYLTRMSAFVRIDVERAQVILSPAYDQGATAEGLKADNLARLNAL